MSSVRALSPEALEELRAASRIRKEPGFARRSRGVLMFAEGRRYKYICEALAVSKEAVRLWLRAYEANGIAGLIDQPRPPRARIKSRQIEEAVEEVIHRPPSDFGFDRSTWSLESLTEYVLASRGVQVGLQTVREVLSERGYRWRRAKHSVTSPDPDYQAKKGQWTR
jgi:transposase